MKQLVLDLKSGKTHLLNVPAPAVADGQLLIQTSCSLVSLGTEKMLVDFGKGGWISKAKQQPERVQQVIQKIKTDGLKPTLDAVFNKLGQPLPLGYSQCGTVIGVGKGVNSFKIGDRVASNGHHAEVVSVPYHLAAKVPDNVSDEAAAFTVLSAIALQSIRLLNPTFGETVSVIGLGLIGQLTVQLLQANGCKVIGFDVDDEKLKAANHPTLNSNENDAVAYTLASTNNIGVDGVIITASASNDSIIAQAAQMCRKRGRIILTGVIDLDIKRSDFYEKELTFQVSCAYGPGRYEPAYEQQGLDYPIGFVRWTEQRNFEAVLAAMARGQLTVASLIAQRIALDNYEEVYGEMGSQNGATILQYDVSKKHSQSISTNTISSTAPGNIGIIGAGSFTTGVLLPSLQKAGASIHTIASKGGLSAAAAAQKFGVSKATTNYEEILNDSGIDTVFITTQHQQHAAMVSSALLHGKNVFVEKPLAIDEAGLQQVIEAYKASGKQLFVGFNRRFAPMAIRMKELMQNAGGPINISMTVNAGPIPAKHWLNTSESGGRLIGEACHFIDLSAFLANAKITAVCALESQPDCASIMLRFANNSTATVNYLTNGSKAYDKERIEVFSDGRTLILENWKKLRGYGFKAFTSKSGSQDKGHEAQFKEVISCLKNGKSQLISFESLVNTTRATIAITESVIQNKWIEIL